MVRVAANQTIRIRMCGHTLKNADPNCSHCKKKKVLSPTKKAEALSIYYSLPEKLKKLYNIIREENGFTY